MRGGVGPFFLFFAARARARAAPRRAVVRRGARSVAGTQLQIFNLELRAKMKSHNMSCVSAASGAPRAGVLARARRRRTTAREP